jgi:hypothetical protein
VQSPDSGRHPQVLESPKIRIVFFIIAFSSFVLFLPSRKLQPHYHTQQASYNETRLIFLLGRACAQARFLQFFGFEGRIQLQAMLAEGLDIREALSLTFSIITMTYSYNAS